MFECFLFSYFTPLLAWLINYFLPPFFFLITNHQFGMWVTAFVAFDNKNRRVRRFLDFWFLQTLNYTTQDQVSFSYCAQKLNIIPYTLPDADVWGPEPHKETYFYTKWDHGAR
jgi:hypothetical protein